MKLYTVNFPTIAFRLLDVSKRPKALAKDSCLFPLTPLAAYMSDRFEVKKWSAVAFWSWDIQIETCAICRNHIMDICIECQAENGDPNECTVSWGMCNHAFHSHCISRWLKSRPVCPLDNQPWELQKAGR